MAEKDKTERKVTRPINMQLAEQSRNVWRVFVANGTTPADIRDASFWSHVAKQLRPGDRLEVEPDNGEYLAFLRVLDAGPQYAKVQLLKADEAGIYRLDTVVPDASAVLPGHSIEWSGGNTKWRVLRDSDKKVLKDGFSSRSDATSWLIGHGKALAA